MDTLTTEHTKMPTREYRMYDYAEELEYAASLFRSYSDIKEYDLVNSSIIGGMLHSMIDSPIMRMAVYEVVGSLTNRMYPDAVIVITWTEEQLEEMGFDVDLIMQRQNYIIESLENLKIEFIKVNAKDEARHTLIQTHMQGTFATIDEQKQQYLVATQRYNTEISQAKGRIEEIYSLAERAISH